MELDRWINEGWSWMDGQMKDGVGWMDK